MTSSKWKRGYVNVIDYLFKDEPLIASLTPPIYLMLLVIMIKFILLGMDAKLITDYTSLVMLVFLVYIALMVTKIRISGYSGIMSILTFVAGFDYLFLSRNYHFSLILKLLTFFGLTHVGYIIGNKFYGDKK